jgi:hypothetical protein
VTKENKKPQVYDFDHEDGLASQMTDKQIEGAASSLKKLMDREMREDPELAERIRAKKRERLARDSEESK